MGFLERGGPDPAFVARQNKAKKRAAAAAAAEPQRKKVFVVGAGPAGLIAALHLQARACGCQGLGSSPPPAGGGACSGRALDAPRLHPAPTPPTASACCRRTRAWM